MTYNIAVVGATGAVGREMLQTLSERNFPVKDIYALASKASTGKEVSFGDDKILKVLPLEGFDFEKVDIALFSAGSDAAKKFAPIAGKKGCIVIDNSSFFRMNDDVPLIVPEVNPEAINLFKKKNIIANPNCSTIQLVVALKPIHDEFKITRVVVSTYQAVSGAGKPAMDELFNQTKGMFVNDQATPEQFTKKIAFNVIPHIDDFMDDGFTKEEWKMRVETKKILDPNINLVAQCVRVPVFIGHSEAVFLECENDINETKVRNLLKKAPGVTVIDHRANEGYVTPVEVAGEDDVYISRIRKDPSVKNGIIFWCVGDNLRKGAALNTVQIAELLVSKKLKGVKL
ncbi:MAG: aspartate-semialdehyde dehydrogenase [Proteobacteria bacterium]|jgi:aspartate-semialdehyde dehydrogenase|nr:aspartate-semialdehyde dehydrogenase [Pseudomonadota bacterium]MDA1135129.1 aspartate-semialdehyde dehydrogenase [Pseudomonadota bacterium]